MSCYCRVWAAVMHYVRDFELGDASVCSLPREIDCCFACALLLVGCLSATSSIRRGVHRMIYNKCSVGFLLTIIILNTISMILVVRAITAACRTVALWRCDTDDYRRRPRLKTGNSLGRTGLT